MSSKIFPGVNLITKQNFHRVTILRLRVKSLSRLILENRKAGGHTHKLVKYQYFR